MVNQPKEEPVRMLILTIKACVLLAGAPYIVANSKTQKANHPINSYETKTIKATVEKVNKDTFVKSRSKGEEDMAASQPSRSPRRRVILTRSSRAIQ